MKRILSFLIIFLLSAGVSFAADAQRKITTGVLTTSQVVKASAGTIYAIEIASVQAAGSAVIWDSSTSTTTGDKEIADITEATQYDSKHINLGVHGIKAHKGIYLVLTNATAIIHYY